MIAVLALVLVALQATPSTTADTSLSPPKPAPNGPVVVLETSLGTVKIGLHQDKAPLSVQNFLQYVRDKHYDGTIFHRVIPSFMIQGGGFDEKLVQKPVRPAVKNEAANGLRNSRGTVAMARTSDPDSATAQFFISVKDNHNLDYGISGAGYAVFGEVIEGMDVVDKIAAVGTGTQKGMGDVPTTPVLIQTARELGAKTAAPAAAPKTAPVAPKPAVKPSPKPKA